MGEELAFAFYMKIGKFTPPAHKKNQNQFRSKLSSYVNSLAAASSYKSK